MAGPIQACRRSAAPSSSRRRHRLRRLLGGRSVEWHKTRSCNSKRTMAMSSRLCWMIAAAALGLAGCNAPHTHIGDEDAAFGESVKYDLAIQTINPEPVYPPGAA